MVSTSEQALLWDQKVWYYIEWAQRGCNYPSVQQDRIIACIRKQGQWHCLMGCSWWSWIFCLRGHRDQVINIILVFDSHFSYFIFIIKSDLYLFSSILATCLHLFSSKEQHTWDFATTKLIPLKMEQIICMLLF